MLDELFQTNRIVSPVAAEAVPRQEYQRQRKAIGGWLAAGQAGSWKTVVAGLRCSGAKDRGPWPRVTGHTWG